MKISLFQDLAAARLERSAERVDLIFGQKDRHKLVATFTDLAPYRIETDLLFNLLKCIDPTLSVNVVRIDQRSIDIKNDGFDHLVPTVQFESNSTIQKR